MRVISRPGNVICDAAASGLGVSGGGSARFQAVAAGIVVSGDAVRVMALIGVSS
jgi:hypothetical protein